MFELATIKRFFKRCLGLDELPDILESEMEGRLGTNDYMEESWDRPGISSFIITHDCF